jgi:putative nucleotidyltransferase with HDIG domain
MKRILLVDAEAAQGASFLARRFGWSSDWDWVLADGGEAGLKALFQSACDVVVSDLRLPGMDGVEFLGLVMQRYPQTVRVLLAEPRDREKVLRSIGTAHRYLPKPCTPEELRAALEQAVLPGAALRSGAVVRLISQIQSLPSLPTLYLHLVEELRSEDPSTHRIAAIVSRDLGMTSKLLQLVNSVFFGLARHISSMEEAVVFLGVETIKSLVLYLHIILLYEHTQISGLSLEQLWHHSGRVGRIAQSIARTEQMPSVAVDQALIAGLLHDLGKVILATGLAGQYQKALSAHQGSGRSLSEAEVEIFGASHAEVGAYLLGLWGIPPAVVDAVALHHRPSDTSDSTLNLSLVVHVANVLDHELRPVSGSTPGGGLDLGRVAGLGLEPRIEEWRHLATTLPV